MTKNVSTACLAIYISLIFVSTVLSRELKESGEYILRPFWTYTVIARGGCKAMRLAQEVAFNVLMMVPVGFLFPLAATKKQLQSTLIFGAALSLTIELLQLITKRGYFEIDDLIHNILGAFVGFGIYKGVYCCCRRTIYGRQNNDN